MTNLFDKYPDQVFPPCCIKGEEDIILIGTHTQTNRITQITSAKVVNGQIGPEYVVNSCDLKQYKDLTIYSRHCKTTFTKKNNSTLLNSLVK